MLLKRLIIYILVILSKYKLEAYIYKQIVGKNKLR